MQRQSPIHNEVLPAVSNYVVCETEAELEDCLQHFRKTDYQCPGRHGFSKKFGWVIDHLGFIEPT